MKGTGFADVEALRHEVLGICAVGGDCRRFLDLEGLGLSCVCGSPATGRSPIA